MERMFRSFQVNEIRQNGPKTPKLGPFFPSAHENAPANRGVLSLESIDQLREVLLAEAIYQPLHGDGIGDSTRAKLLAATGAGSAAAIVDLSRILTPDNHRQGFRRE
jgi:hypothetical protein